MLIHPFEPIVNENSRVLILGTFPSVKSRNFGFYYGHPQNRFWKLLAAILGEQTPSTVDEKRQLLLVHRLALWDVLASCKIDGSSDASIREAVPNNIAGLTAEYGIERVICNGGKAYELCIKYNNLALPVEKLPSTSPANASWSLEGLIKAWEIAITLPLAFSANL
jgi:hypoxanthine-DNA glycosylase